MYPKLVTVCGRSQTGISRPFLCEADDGYFYYVKSENVTSEQRVKDFVFSRLAEEVGLPVSPVQILEIPEVLASYVVVEGKEEFRPGLALGSRRIQFADEIRSAHLRQVDDDIKMRILCYDWWTQNPDRQLDLIGGDPNVLWDPVLQSIFIIDHDRCLEEDFDPTEFKRHHVFRDVMAFMEEAFLKKWRTKFESSIYGWNSIWEELPPSWLEDESGIARISFSREELEASLIKPEISVEGVLAS